MITFKSVGHFFATAYTKLLSGLVKVEATESTVEKVTSVVPTYGPLALTIEKAGYAVLGELSAILNAGGAAAEAKLADVGLDGAVVSTVKALIASLPELALLAKSL